MNSRHNAFNPLWFKDPEFKHWIDTVPNNPHRAACILCEKDFVIGDIGYRALKAHANSSRHRLRQQMSSRPSGRRPSNAFSPGSSSSSPALSDRVVKQ
ncbi:hypothetical protein SK128_027230, partial [Halocaridina rubra]